MTSTTAMFPQRFMWLVMSAVLLTLSGSMVVEAAPPTSVLQPEKFTEPNLDLSLSLPRHDSHVDTNLRLGSIYPTSAERVGADDSTRLRANGGRYGSANSERTLKDPRIDPEMGELPLSLAPPGPRALVAAGKRPMSARLQSEMDAAKTPVNGAPITLQRVDGDEAGSSSAPAKARAAGDQMARAEKKPMDPRLYLGMTATEAGLPPQMPRDGAQVTQSRPINAAYLQPSSDKTDPPAAQPVKIQQNPPNSGQNFHSHQSSQSNSPQFIASPVQSSQHSLVGYDPKTKLYYYRVAQRSPAVNTPVAVKPRPNAGPSNPDARLAQLTRDPKPLGPNEIRPPLTYEQIRHLAPYLNEPQAKRFKEYMDGMVEPDSPGIRQQASSGITFNRLGSDGTRSPNTGSSSPPTPYSNLKPNV
ncbi:hypothetical protein PGT21_025816 [Puccinia graminis f. sp. tritici]|uniref:Uncharacterized protein n=1 Tax=Puccinia graminis f. sp. tritici TaxID=56615 RepID=A0A5B0M4W0_PUCGR|nr:hypothetical protein PGT21_025816 [Puccinia graminis f. sp. tritici]KAA1132608.1 hypothetical protein PGTUg99_013474 [Puccinia graminis f. sp. tritici]